MPSKSPRTPLTYRHFISPPEKHTFFFGCLSLTALPTPPTPLWTVTTSYVSFIIQPKTKQPFKSGQIWFWFWFLWGVFCFLWGESSFFFFFFFWPCYMVCRILVPWPGIEPRPWQWKRQVLTTGPLEVVNFEWLICIIHLLLRFPLDWMHWKYRLYLPSFKIFCWYYATLGSKRSGLMNSWMVPGSFDLKYVSYHKATLTMLEKAHPYGEATKFRFCGFITKEKERHFQQETQQRQK